MDDRHGCMHALALAHIAGIAVIDDCAAEALEDAVQLVRVTTTLTFEQVTGRVVELWSSCTIVWTTTVGGECDWRKRGREALDHSSRRGDDSNNI